MPFLPRRKIAFSIFCVLRVTDCLETLVWRSFFKASSPEAVTVGRSYTLTGKVKASSKGLFHHVFSIGEISEPRSIWSYLASYGYTPCVWTWLLDLWGKICIFLSGGPNTVWPSNCLKIHPIAVFLLLNMLDLLHSLGFLKQAGSSQLLALGSFAVECHLDEVTTVLHPALSDTLLQPSSSWAVVVWPRNVLARLRNCRETHGPDSGI